MEQILSSFIAAFSVILVALISTFAAKRVGLGQSQEKLVSTLKELIEIQNNKIKHLEIEQSQYIKRIQTLEQKVDDLTTLTVNQALEIERLRQGRDD